MRRKNNNSSLQDPRSRRMLNSRGMANHPHRDLRGKVDSRHRVWEGEAKELDGVDLNRKELDGEVLYSKELGEEVFHNRERAGVDLLSRVLGGVDLNNKAQVDLGVILEVQLAQGLLQQSLR
ncbi:hypothetical protein QQF64_012598 [Cirrhinus molitorella]|uniref:Uncharacterized protein n=1 Tax=Cirrhinus molitorella TaxID=172907 RepID=A0ABR3LW53_9TELE